MCCCLIVVSLFCLFVVGVVVNGVCAGGVFLFCDVC